MKNSSRLLTFFAVLVVFSAVYRALPFDSKPLWLGAPQLALALFAGSVIPNRKWAFAVPLISLLLSDFLMQALHSAGLTPGFPGFYKGQFFNYTLIALLTVVGFFVNKNRVTSIATGILATPTLFFLLSNFGVWAWGGGLNRPKTFSGLMQCYADGLPFYGYSLLTMAVFSTLFFGSYVVLSGSVRSSAIKA